MTYPDNFHFKPMSSQSTFFNDWTRSQTPRNDFLDLRVRQDFMSDDFGPGWRRTLKVSVLAGSRLFTLKVCLSVFRNRLLSAGPHEVNPNADLSTYFVYSSASACGVEEDCNDCGTSLKFTKNAAAERSAGSPPCGCA